MKTTLLMVGVVLIAGGLVMCGCGKMQSKMTKVNKDNYEKIKTGMTPAEVVSILGEADETKTGGASVVGIGGTGTTMIWKSGKEMIRVEFINDKVVKKDLGQTESR